jgi:hypothetical protein
MERTPIYVGVNRYRFDAHLATGADDTHRDLTAICDQNSFKHRELRFLELSETAEGLDVIKRLKEGE